jgi:hypothetical protein
MKMYGQYGSNRPHQRGKSYPTLTYLFNENGQIFARKVEKTIGEGVFWGYRLNARGMEIHVLDPQGHFSDDERYFVRRKPTTKHLNRCTKEEFEEWLGERV